MLVTTWGSANKDVNKFDGKRTKEAMGDGQVAWKALREKHDGQAKEARWPCHKTLVYTEMEPGQDPDHFFLTLASRHDLLKEIGQKKHNEQYDGIILQALSAACEHVQNASYEKESFGLYGIRYMVHALYVTHLCSLRTTRCSQATASS